MFLIKIKFFFVGIVLLGFNFKTYAQTVDLSTHTNSTAIFPVVLQWHNSATPNASSLLSSTIITATNTSTNYWVYYYDSVNLCYSPGNKVTIVSNTCPSTTVNLNTINVSGAPMGTTLNWYTSNIPSASTLVNTSTAVGAGTYYASYYDSANNCYSPTSTPVIVVIRTCTTNFCYKNANETGTVLETTQGITALGRAGTGYGNWPMVRKGAWTALESKEKGFVINRIKFNASNHPVADDGTTLIINNPVEGMIVYDITNNCLKIYTTKEGDTTPNWHCFNTKACPD